MKTPKIVNSASAFALITILPILKVAILGKVADGDEQALYLRLYFFVQFLVPIIDFGYYWGKIRTQLEGKQEQIQSFDGFSAFGFCGGSHDPDQWQYFNSFTTVHRACLAQSPSTITVGWKPTTLLPDQAWGSFD